MFTRITQCMLVAALVGILLISFVRFSGTATAEESKLPRLDVTLASPATVELPATIVLSSSQPDVRVGCYSGTPYPDHPEWGPAPGIPIVPCSPSLVGRSGPDANGWYLSEWWLPLFQPGAITFSVASGADSTLMFNTITFTVTGNRFNYTDFRSCTREDVFVNHTGEWFRNHPKWVPISQVLVDYYAQINTTLTYQLQQKVRTKTNRWRWVAVKKYQKRWDFPVAHSELEKGYGPFERRETKQNVPQELLYPSKRPAPKYRVVYFVRQGKKLLKRGVVSREPCQKIDDPPYYIP